MSSEVEFVMRAYADAYEKLYKRRPADLRVLDENWVVVNGARMRLNELRRLTHRIQLESQAARNEQRNAIRRLISWFTG